MRNLSIQHENNSVFQKIDFIIILKI